MYKNRDVRPQCTRDDDDRDSYIVSRDMKDPKYRERIVYEDGSSKVVWGGPCGSTCYDEDGEEC